MDRIYYTILLINSWVCSRFRFQIVFIWGWRNNCWIEGYHWCILLHASFVHEQPIAPFEEIPGIYRVLFFEAPCCETHENAYDKATKDGDERKPLVADAKHPVHHRAAAYIIEIILNFKVIWEIASKLTHSGRSGKSNLVWFRTRGQFSVTNGTRKRFTPTICWPIPSVSWTIEAAIGPATAPWAQAHIRTYF